MPPKTMAGTRSSGAVSLLHERPTTHFDDSLGFSEHTEVDSQTHIPKGSIPANQIKNLSDRQLEMSFTRTITAMDPNVKKTAVKYHYKESVYRPQARNDHLAVHFAMDGNLVHVGSAEGRYLSQFESHDAMRSGIDDPEGQFKTSTSVQVGDPEMMDDSIGEGVIIGSDALMAPLSSKPVKNQFNFTERACMTFKQPTRSKAIATAPPPRRDGSGSITQWVIFDTYLKEYNNQLAARDQRDSRKPGKDDNSEGVKEEGSTSTNSASNESNANNTASGDNAGAGAEDLSSLHSFDEAESEDVTDEIVKKKLMLASTEPQSNPDVILALPSLANALKVMERAVNQTSSIDAFRDFKFDEIGAMLAVQENVVKNADAANPPQIPAVAPEGKGVAGNYLAPGRDGLRNLWTYGYDASQAHERVQRGGNKSVFAATSNASTLTNQQTYDDGHSSSSKTPLKKTVTAIAWNPTYADLFAVGLGSYDYLKQSGGYVCCYSLKNASFPEAKFKTTSGVLCLDWHPNLPSLLVVGLHDGTICIYDVKSKTNDPIFSTTNPSTRHTGPVWQVAWDSDTTILSFCSLSSDGRYVRWIVNKNDLDQDEVLTIALRDNNADASKIYEEEGLGDKFDPSLVTAASGTCFDINPTLNLLVVGTEEGNVSTYDVLHNSKFAFGFAGHNMSVYSVKWSPFHPTVFLSCSADWTVKIWEYTTRNAIMTFDMHGPVGDVAWAPYKSTVFGCVTQEGFVKIFDLALDKASPICDDYRPVANPNVRLTHLAFNSKEPVLAVTDHQGGIHVLKLTGRLYKLNALELEDIDPVLEQDILRKLLIIQDENGNNKVTSVFRTAWAKQKTEERLAAEKKAAEASLAKKSAVTEADD